MDHALHPEDYEYTMDIGRFPDSSVGDVIHLQLRPSRFVHKTVTQLKPHNRFTVAGAAPDLHGIPF